MKDYYTTFPGQLTKQEAITLIETIAKDLRNSKEKRDRAIMWGRDMQGLTYKEIATALGFKSHTYVIQRYQELKGGEQHEQY